MNYRVEFKAFFSGITKNDALHLIGDLQTDLARVEVWDEDLWDDAQPVDDSKDCDLLFVTVEINVSTSSRGLLGELVRTAQAYEATDLEYYLHRQ